ncbi:MAG: hypothetical protein ACQET5_09605 [Halobacteriota archaeon]
MGFSGLWPTPDRGSLPVTFLFNLGTGMSGIGTLATVLIVICVLALTNLAIGYLLRTGSAITTGEVTEASNEPTV